MREPRFQKPFQVSPEERTRILDTLREALASREWIVFAYLYGSFARGGPARDIDVALYVEPAWDRFPVESDLALELTQQIGHPVDVKIINQAPVAVRMEVLRSGKPLFCRDAQRRAEFIEQTSKQYLEYAHLRDLSL